VPVIVRCCVCDKAWDALDAGVVQVHATWWCRGARACQRRKAALVARMQAALDAVWASLEADGWRWPV
jgi:hypothetical protein